MTDPTASAHAHAHAHAPVVLDEDVWLAAIEEIVGRDFFPDARAVERPAGNVDVSGLSLDEFLHKYTSEDNASFQEILEKTNAKRREKVAHLMLPPAARPASAQARLEQKKYEAVNLLMYDGSTRSSLPLARIDAAAETSGRPSKRIQHKATALAAAREADADDTDDTLAVAVAGGNGGNGDYSMVDTPLLRPGKEVTPFMTWGAIGATPVRLDEEEDDDAPKQSAFRMRETPLREQIAHSLGGKGSKGVFSARGRRTPGTSRTPAGLAGRDTPMSPAARELRTKQLQQNARNKRKKSSGLFADPRPRPRSSWDEP